MLELILGGIIVVLLGIIGFGSWVVYRGLNRMNETDNVLEDLSYHLSIFYTMSEEVLSRELYSNEPTIIAFMDQLKLTSEILKSYDQFFQIAIIKAKDNTMESQDESG